MNETKNSSGIPFVAVVIVLVINIVIYNLSEFGGQLFFGFFGFWFLLYGIYKLIKIFKSDF